MNLAHFLRQAARRFGDEIGFVWGETTWTWAELDRRVDAMAAALAASGVAKGDRVLVQAKNCNQLFEIMFACFRLGAVWVPTNFRQTPAEVAYLAEASGAVRDDLRRRVSGPRRRVAGGCPDIRLVISIGDARVRRGLRRRLSRAISARPFPTADVEHDDPCWFFFTSGTTGRPKAAVLTHGQMGFVVTNHLVRPDAGQRPRPTPRSSWRRSRTGPASTSSRRSPGRQKRAARPATGLSRRRRGRWSQRWRITNMFTVPTIVKMLTEHPSVDRHDHSRLRHVIYAGAPMYREDQKHALRKLGPVLVQYFGLGEVTGNITVLPPALHDAEDGPGVALGTCGYERTGDADLDPGRRGPRGAAGETGEICVCGLAVFAGYYNNPEANAKAFRNGWFRTGDLVNASGLRFLLQQLQRLIHGLMREPEGSVVHGDHPARVKSRKARVASAGLAWTLRKGGGL